MALNVLLIVYFLIGDDMCGRFSQYQTLEHYAAQIDWNNLSNASDTYGKYNVPPGTQPLVFHQLTNMPEQTQLFWGYKPSWYQKAPIINARLDTILSHSPMWRPLLKRRILVPADGWFEWTGKAGDKQPWYICAADKKPIFMAAITAWEPNKDHDPAHGFAIITDYSAGGMVNIHDRRPIVLTPEAALEWISNDTSPSAVIELLSTARSESAFNWYPVTRQVNNSQFQSAESIVPITL